MGPKTYTFDEICESRDFEHSQMFVTAESYGVMEAELYSVRQDRDRLDDGNIALNDELEIAIEALEYYEEHAPPIGYGSPSNVVAKEALEKIRSRKV